MQLHLVSRTYQFLAALSLRLDIVDDDVSFSIDSYCLQLDSQQARLYKFTLCK